MLLDRLRIRGKLALLVLVPVITMIVLAVANSAQLIASARRADSTAEAVRVASLTGAVVLELQEERLFSMGTLRGQVEPGELLRSRADVTESIVTLRSQLGADLPPVLRNALNAVTSLSTVRTAVDEGTATVPFILASFGEVIGGLLDATNLLRAVDGDTDAGRQVVALDSVLRFNEAFAVSLAVMASAQTPADMTPYQSGLAVIEPAVARFLLFATPEQVDVYAQAAKSIDVRLGSNFSTYLAIDPAGALSTLTAIPTFASIESLSAIGVFVAQKIVNDVLAIATDRQRSQDAAAAGFAGLSFLAVLAALALATAVVRSVSSPLTRLTRSADGVVRLAESELVRVADDDSLAAEPVRLQPIDVEGRDELADLARAFARVQATAAQLVERQVASRRNVALMFGHVGRRTQNLVGRQVALIDRLENDETEPRRLRELYRLDHVSSRLLRNASSLVVLSGATGADEHMAPLGFNDVVRLALAQIEDYQRVDVDVATAAQVVPALVNDLVLVFAELMENATSFSPPTTRVVISAVSTPDGARVTVVDHGLGMTPARLAEENARLTRRERLDLTPTEVLGLFVVGRLARRHGLQVVLSSNRTGGVTVTIDLPPRLLTATGRPTTGATGRVSSPSRLPVAPAGLTDADSAMFNVGALTRASQTMQSAPPWNAFAPTARPNGEPPAAAAPLPPAASGMVSALNRRVPGATLGPLDEYAHPPTLVRPHQTGVVGQRPGDAEEVRDNLADFQAGVARAMHEVNRPLEEGNL